MRMWILMMLMRMLILMMMMMTQSDDADELPHRRALPGDCACVVPQAPLRLWSAVACGGVLGLRSECGRSLMWECERRGDLTTGRAAASAVVP